MERLPYPLLYETLAYWGPHNVFALEAVCRGNYAKLSRNPYFLQAMMENVDIEPRLTYSDLKGRLTIQKVLGLEKEAQLANQKFYQALNALKFGVYFFAIFFVIILFLGHYLSENFNTVYQGQGHIYWSGNSTMVTAVNGWNETYVEALYIDLGEGISKDGDDWLEWKWNIADPENWVDIDCYEFVESDNEIITMFQDMAEAGSRYGNWNGAHNYIFLALFWITIYILRSGKFFTCWSWWLFVIYLGAMSVKIKAILILTEYVQYWGDWPLITTEDISYPVWTAFAISWDVFFLVLAALYYIFMLGLVFYILYTAGRHRSIISTTEKYRVFTIVD